MNKRAVPPPTAEEVAAQAEMIVELRKRMARLERALLATAEARLGGCMELGGDLYVGPGSDDTWLIYNKNAVEVNVASDPTADVVRYATVLEAFDAAAKACAPPVFDDKAKAGGE